MNKITPIISYPSPFVGKRVKIKQELVRFKNGDHSTFETAEVQNAAAVLPVDSEGNIYLIKNYRHPIKDYLYEIPAGKIDDKDHFLNSANPSLSAAQRELQEETGLIANKWEHLGDFFSSPGWTNEVISIYLAFELTQKESNPEDSEDIQVVKCSPEQINAMMNSGSIKDMKTFLAISNYLRKGV